MIELHAWVPHSLACGNAHLSMTLAESQIFHVHITHFYSNDEVRLCNELRSKQPTLSTGATHAALAVYCT